MQLPETNCQRNVLQGSTNYTIYAVASKDGDLSRLSEQRHGNVSAAITRTLGLRVCAWPAQRPMPSSLWHVLTVAVFCAKKQRCTLI